MSKTVIGIRPETFQNCEPIIPKCETSNLKLNGVTSGFMHVSLHAHTSERGGFWEGSGAWTAESRNKHGLCCCDEEFLLRLLQRWSVVCDSPSSSGAWKAFSHSPLIQTHTHTNISAILCCSSPAAFSSRTRIKWNTDSEISYRIIYLTILKSANKYPPPTPLWAISNVHVTWLTHLHRDAYRHTRIGTSL